MGTLKDKGRVRRNDRRPRQRGGACDGLRIGAAKALVSTLPAPQAPTAPNCCACNSAAARGIDRPRAAAASIRRTSRRTARPVIDVQVHPFEEPILRIIDAFGLKRCMWGTDWTRTIGMLTYEQGVAPFRDTKRLSESDKAALMGGTLQRVYSW
jgi:hypothetical protein